MKASYGRFDTFDGEAFVSGPITDTLGFRLAGSTTQSGSWQYSYTRDDKLGKQDILRGRLLLDWKPTDTLSFLFSANGWRNKSDTQAAQLVGLSLQQDASAPGQYDPVETSGVSPHSGPFLSHRATHVPPIGIWAGTRAR